MEQVGEKWSTVSTHRHADSLFKKKPTKHSKYAVNQNLEHLNDISLRLLFGRIRVCLFVGCKIRICSFRFRFQCEGKRKSFECL